MIIDDRYRDERAELLFANQPGVLVDVGDDSGRDVITGSLWHFPAGENTGTGLFRILQKALTLFKLFYIQ